MREEAVSTTPPLEPGPSESASALPPRRPVVPSVRRESFYFTGLGGEYFRIWIVNLLLSVVTLGIYSAWAKVRRMDYFYRNTRVAGSTFVYHGSPLAILKGRLIAGAVFGVYYVAGYLDPRLGAVALLLIFAALPWMLVRALRFRAHNTSYRGIRFGFHGSARGAYWVWLLLPFLNIFTLSTLTPFVHQRTKRYQHGNSSYGRTPFTFDAPVSGFYKAYLTVIGCVIGLIVLTGVAFWLIIDIQKVSGSDGVTSSVLSLLAVAVLVLAYAVGAAGSWALMTSRITNLVWNHTRVGSCRFHCTLEANRLFLLMFTNALGMIFTLGLFKPFAQIRLATYMVGEFSLLSEGSLDDFIAGERQNVGAFGEEAAEFFDLDIAV
jgi:uncharacterized membrane protein YjgN (DUF898 family)